MNYMMMTKRRRLKLMKKKSTRKIVMMRRLETIEVHMSLHKLSHSLIIPWNSTVTRRVLPSLHH